MNYTSIEQSKKLLELGLKPDTADMWWTPLNWQLTEYYVEVKQDGIGTPKNALPCWSLDALLGVLPFHLIVNNQRYAFSMHKGLNKDGETYMFRYNIFNTDICLYSTDYYNNSVDACYEMIIKLYELKLL